MEKMQSYKTHVSLLSLLFLFQFLSLQLSSSAYTVPDKYFINCGSNTNITSSGRIFIGDMTTRIPDSFTFTKQSSPVKDSNKSTATPPLYQTARIFWQQSSYQFEISSNGTYLLRLHFFSFSSSDNLSTALFDVSASGFSLLHNFTAKNSSNPLLIKEFFLSIAIGQFVILFSPQESSFAFVNAIEVFLTPQNFIPDAAPNVSPTGSRSNYQGILSKALQPIHRINVGGLTLTPENDTLGRYWVPDDSYLYIPETAKNSKFYSSPPNYQVGISEYTAPNLVYQTAKEMNINTSRVSNMFNITWSFMVTKNARHFVRAHFCDIISSYLSIFLFNLYIYANFSFEINPYDITGQLAVPFYRDFIVHSDDSGLMNISIGPRSDSIEQTAFLNGLEIMEIMGDSGSVARINEPLKTHIFVVVGPVIGGFALICTLAFAIRLCLRSRKPKTVETLDWSPVSTYRRGSSHSRVPEGIVRSSIMPNLNLGLRVSLDEMLFATNNFDAENKIGRGGFGNVFKGTLRSGKKVAVKRSEPGLGQGLPEFQTEIMVLSKIRHRHLVSLIAYCDEGDEMILVYEFMEKGTLRDHLYNSSLPSLSWKQRLEICIGAAEGLHYLHRGASGGFIHRDIKSTNILLDENLVAKVSDFGLSRLGSPDQTYVTTGVKGTIGYLDPDYFRTQQLTEKSDVYSFGVVLLEVLCARPAINTLLPLEQVNLAEWAMFCKNKGILEQILDPSIKSDINPNSLRKFAEIAEKCLQECGADRPTMSDILWDLEYALQLQKTAVQRELHEDSTTDVSAALALPNIQRLPSITTSFERDDMPILREDYSHTLAAEVFSDLRIGHAR